MKPMREKPLERLIEAEPMFYSSPGRPGVKLGMIFQCPIHSNEGDNICHVGVQFENPSDGGKPEEPEAPTWLWNGEDFEKLSLAPSIRVMGSAPGQCRWHGFIRDGRFEHCGDAR